MPLNQSLYARLEHEFGRVRVSREGEGIRRTYVRDEMALHSREKLVIPQGGSGEYYVCCCPFCHDTRYRLYINHVWGVYDERTGDHNLWLATCYNDQCLSKDTSRYRQLYERVWGFKNANDRNVVHVDVGEVYEGPPPPVTMPGDWYELADMDADTPPMRYLTSRGYDARAMAREYDLGYCVRAVYPYYPAQGRIIIPIRMNGVLVGWQARYVGELDWKATGIPKYYNLPNMPRRLMLYNYDRAVQGDYCVLVEGPISAWQVGKHAVASFGKSVSGPQLELLAKWKAVVILFDGDEKGIEASQGVYDDLLGRVPFLVPMQLPKGLDPGNCSHEYLEDVITASAAVCGYDLNNLPEDPRREHVPGGGDAEAGGGGGGGVPVVGPVRRLPPPGRIPNYSPERP